MTTGTYAQGAERAGAKHPCDCGFSSITPANSKADILSVECRSQA